MLEAATLATISTASSVQATFATIATGACPAPRAAGIVPATPPPPFWSEIGFSSSGGQLMGLFKDGGPFMWPILLASLIAVIFLIDRLVGLSIEARATGKMLKALKTQVQHLEVGPQELVSQCAALSKEFTKSPVSTMAIAGLEKLKAGEYRNVERAIDRAGQAEMARLEKGLPALASVSNIAPLIGFLGTVWGIILAFHVIGLKKVVNPQDISDGISQALIMSAAGLSVAIPASGAYNFFATRVSRIAVLMQEGAYLLTILCSAVVKQTGAQASGGAEAPTQTEVSDGSDESEEDDR